MTPRPYLSWSSLNLLEKNPEQWKKVYLYNERMGTNRGMAFGKQMADGLENDEATGNAILDMVMTKIPKFEIMDKEFMAEIKNGKEVIPILCKPDTMKADMTAFKEYKTSQSKWSKKKVDESGQVTFYAMGMFLKTGKVPGDIELVEIETKSGLDARIEATGAIYRHPTVRTVGQILNMIVRAKKAWVEINRICEEELL
jgi:hypothetical protein